jgi:hypothetical protein
VKPDLRNAHVGGSGRSNLASDAQDLTSTNSANVCDADAISVHPMAATRCLLRPVARPTCDARLAAMATMILSPECLLLCAER